MAIDEDKLSPAESLTTTRTFGQVRCHNPSCMGRIKPTAGSEQIVCPTCGMAYRLVWVRPDLPRIRGPVWEINRRIAAEILAKKTDTPTDDPS